MILIKLCDVVKEFDTGSVKIKALNNISLQIDKGSFIAILGPSGSGKSTLMNIIGLLDTPSSGEYYLDGNNVLLHKEEELTQARREKIGFVFQKFNLLPKLTALQNVELPLLFRGIDKSAASKRAIKMLELVGLSERLHHKPNELSGGQQQRVSIARALIGEPPVILADEPTGALDSKSSTEIIALLKQLNNLGHTVIIITHDHDIAEQAQEIIYLVDGQLTRTNPFKKVVV